MKKSLLISATLISTFSLAAFSLIDWDQTQDVSDKLNATTHTCAPSNENRMKVVEQPPMSFIYNVSNRFAHAITKENLLKAKSIFDIVPQWNYNHLSDFKDVKVTIYHNKTEISENGLNSNLNQKQLALLKKLNYSTNFYINASCSRTDSITGLSKEIDVAYYITVIPEQIAQYSEGIHGLEAYLKDQSQLETAYVAVEKLNSGKIYFIVNAQGNIEGSKIESSCGNEAIDSKMLSLIRNMPGTWEAARNSDGEKINQGMVYSYAQMGC